MTISSHFVSKWQKGFSLCFFDVLDIGFFIQCIFKLCKVLESRKSYLGRKNLGCCISRDGGEIPLEKNQYELRKLQASKLNRFNIITRTL